MPKHWLPVVLIIIVAVFASACQKAPGGEKIAVLDWQKAAQAHPRYEAWQAGIKDFEKLLTYRKQQTDLAATQMGALQMLRELKQNSKSTYYEADYQVNMYAKQAQEQYKLQQAYNAAAQAVDAEMATEREQLEEEYQLRIFNTRLRLESLRLKPSEKEAVQAELVQIQAEREAKMQALRMTREQLIEVRIAPLRAAMQQDLAQISAELQADAQAKAYAEAHADDEKLALAPKALADALAVIDERLDKMQETNDELERTIKQDIDSNVARLTRERGYSIVFHRIKVNVKADDITGEVIKSLKKMK